MIGSGIMAVAVTVSSFYNFNGCEFDDVVGITCNTDGLYNSLEVESLPSSPRMIDLTVSS